MTNENAKKNPLKPSDKVTATPPEKIEKIEKLKVSGAKPNTRRSSQRAPRPARKVPMTKEELNEIQLKINYLKAEVDEALAKFSSKQNRNGGFGVMIKLLSLALSAVVTVILGLNLEPAIFYNRIALGLSALAGIISGISAFFDFNELSIKYKDTVDKLEVLKVRIEYDELGIRNMTLEAIAELKDEFIDVLNETYAFFQTARKQESDSTGKDTS